MPTVYPSLAIPAPRRLAMFRQEATGKQWGRPMTWRDMRFATLRSHTGLGQGADGFTPVWYTQDGKQFRHEVFATEYMPRARHNGYWGDSENCEKLHRGIIAMLPHGRFIAGYLADDNDERVYFSEVFTDEHEAARAADEHARIAAESEDEYSQRWNEAMRLDGLIEAKGADVEKSYALRNHPKLGQREREFCRETIADIRAMRDERTALKVD